MTGERILVMDDEASIVRLCTQTLTRESYLVQGVTSGREAIRRLESEPFDLLVVNIEMPDVSGLEVLRRARERDPIQAAVVISGFATLNGAIRSLQSGARGFVIKPFSPDELVAAVRETLARRELEQERLRLRAQLPILEVAQTLLVEGDVAYLARRLLETVSSELDAKEAALLLLDERANELYTAESVGLPADTTATMRIPLQGEPAWKTLLGTTPLVLDSEVNLPPPLHKMFSIGVHPIWLPLRTVKGLVGALYLGRPAGHAPFTPADLDLLTIVGGQIATALENASLYEIVTRGKREWETTFDTIADGITIHDTDFRIVRANRALAEHLGLPVETLIGRHCYELIHGTDTLPDWCPSLKARHTGNLEESEVEEPHLGGSFHIAAYPLHDQGRFWGAVHVLRDITERKHAQDALQESQARLLTLFEHSPISIWEEDFSAIQSHFECLRDSGIQDWRSHFETHPDQVAQCAALVKVLDINQTSVKLFESSCKEEILMNLPSYFTTESMAVFRQELIALAEGCSHFESEIPIRTPAGGNRTLFLNLSVVPGCEETLSRVLVSFIDITKLKEAEQALQESEACFRALVESSADHIFMLDREGTYLTSNDQVGHFGLKDSDALVGRQLSDVYPPKVAAFYQEQLEQVFATGRPVKFEHPLPQPNDEHIHLDTLYPIHRDGEVWAAGGICRDITEHKLAEEELRQRNEELAALNAIVTAIGQSPDLDSTLRATLDKTLEVTGMDGGWVHLLSEEDKDTLVLAAQRGMSSEMVDPNGAFRVGQDLTGQAAHSGQPVMLADIAGDPDLGTEAYVQTAMRAVATIPIRSKDRALGALGVFSRHPHHWSPQETHLLTAIGHQVSVAVENAHLAEEAAEIEILREVDRLRSELIANVSHELRTPLGLIKLLSSMLLSEDAALDRETHREFLRHIENEADKLEAIVDNLLDLSRTRSGRLQLDKQPTDLEQLTRTVLKDIEIQSPDHCFAHDFPAGPLVATVDPKRIEQVLRNLLGNAVKYSSGGTAITVRGRRQKQEVLVEVTDQGIGIPAEDLERVFEHFYRVKNEVTRRVGGAGLGLSICRGIVEAHGGRIWATSEPGTGSTFSFILPGTGG